MMDLDKITKYMYILNLSELKQICDNYDINYHIYIELSDGNIKKTSETLHKEFIINKILNKLEHNISDKTIYTLNIQNYDNTNNLSPDSYVYYGQYNTTDKNVKRILKSLTNNKFTFGAISQKIIRKHWIENKLITYRQFANLWLNEYNSGEINYDELAYNKFMKKYGNKNKWLKYKSKIVDFFIKSHML